MMGNTGVASRPKGRREKAYGVTWQDIVPEAGIEVPGVDSGFN